jgi:hypothetical protein
MTRSKFVAAFLLVFAAGGFSTAHAQAPTGAAEWYQGGEADANPVNGGAVTTAVDSGFAGANLTAMGTPLWDSTNFAPAAHLQPANSTLGFGGPSTFSYSFDGGSYFNGTNIASLDQNNFGMEAWVDPASTTGSQMLLYYNDPASGNGWSLTIQSGDYVINDFGGGYNYSENTGVAATPGVWTDFALVQVSGNLDAYINGSLTTTTLGISGMAAPTSPTGLILLGGDSVDNFQGQIDDARIFTFSAGNFSAADDLNFVPANRDGITTLIVPGTANIFGAGHSTPPNPGGGGAGILPPAITFAAGSIASVTFPSISGNIAIEGGESNNANGDGSPFATTNITCAKGISGITAPQAGFLVGVFTSDDKPTNPAPPTLDFTTGNGTNFTTLAPALNQTFFIGAGQTSNGTLQQFTVPAGATHLYLGIADADSAQGAPGFYDDNSGYFTVTANISTPSIPVSVNPSGVFSDNNAFTSTISGNGSVVAFTSLADDLVPGLDPDGDPQVFLWNASNSTVSAAVTLSGNDGPVLPDGPSAHPQLSQNGMFLVFTSYADNIVTNDYNGLGDVFYENLCTGEVDLVSESAEWNMSAHGDSGRTPPAISGDGQTVAFSSNATDLVQDPVITGNDGPQLYLWSANDQTNQLVSFSFDSDAPAQYASNLTADLRFTGQPALSYDGSYIAFISNANNLTSANVTTTDPQVYSVDFDDEGIPTIQSININGALADAPCNNPTLSSDGDIISFESAADNLAFDDDSNPITVPANVTQVYYTDTRSNTLFLGSTAADGTPANANCLHSQLSGDGNLLLFISNATNLVPGHGGNTTAIFIKNLVTGSIIAGGDGADSASFSQDTRYVAFSKLVQDGPLSGSNPPHDQVLRVDLGQSAPVFTQQPQSDEVNVGDNVSFSVTATGNPNPTFQWYFNGTIIDGATNCTLKICNVTVDQAGDYSCVASNALDSVQSDNATLTVDVPVIQPPVLNTVTDEIGAIAGDPVTLEVDATGDPVITYQWYIYNGTTGNWDLIPDATNNTLDFDSVQVSDAGEYEMIATNPGGSTTSDTITLAVVNPGDPPGILDQPETTEVTQNDDASFSVTAFGTGPITYQWFTTDGVNITIVPDATADTLDIPDAQPSGNNSYFVSVTNDNGTTNSTIVNLIVDPGQAPSIESGNGPYSTSVNLGDTAEFYFFGPDGTAPFTYQWFFNDQAISDETDPSLFISNVSLSDAGNYSVEISNDFGNFTSAEATLTVTPPLAAPEILTQPVGVTVAAGNTTTLTVAASGNPSLNYQWLMDGQPLTDGGNITGSNTSSLRLAKITSTQSGQYSVIVYNGLGNPVQSTIVSVNVLFVPQIIQQPIAQLVRIGYQAVFTVVANGNPPLTYQWIKNGKPIPTSHIKRPHTAGTTGNRFVIPSVQKSDAGTYQVRVTDSQGSTLSIAVGLQTRTITAPSQ